MTAAPDFTPGELTKLWAFELADDAPEAAPGERGPLLTDADIVRAADLAADADQS